MGVGGEVQPSFFGSFSSGGGADGSYAAWLGEYAPAGVWPPAPLEGVESAPKLLGEDEACPAPSKLVGESVWGQEESDAIQTRRGRLRQFRHGAPQAGLVGESDRARGGSE